MSLHEMQKCLHIDDARKKKTSKIAGKHIITIKEDGWYVWADFVPTIGWSYLQSSANRMIPAMKNYQERFNKDWKLGVSCRAIFEATIPNTPFHIANGIFNRKYEQVDNVQFFLHDILLLSYGNLVNNRIAIERWRDIETMQLPPYVSIARALGISDSQETWDRLAEMVIDDGEEGIVCKRCDSLYYPGKRNESLLKFKHLITADLKIVDIYETEGEKGNIALNLRLVSKNGNISSVVVPKHNDINYINANRSSLLGTVATIAAKNKLPSGIYREPRFRCLRPDKLPIDID